ncbi:MAG: ArsR family transcriptional regulator [Nanoarchaeota archaeon]
MTKKITIIKIRRAEEGNVNRDLQWLGNSLGLFNLRDKDSSCFRVFISLVRKAKGNDVQAISSDEIAEKLNLSRGTVVHHLSKLMDSGLIVREKEGYILRENSLQRVIKDVESDVESFFSELMEVAKEIDEKLD